MEEILAQLTKKSQYDCEEAHRKIMADTNGLAGIHIINHDVSIKLSTVF